jgi:RNA polymerase sigma-70 factor (ECF subfamily)
MHEAFVRAQRKNRQESLDSREHALAAGTDSRGGNSPEQSAANRELGEALEKAILALPSKYRSVLMMRDIEEMTTAEAADALEISEDAVKVRLHRARALVRRALYRQSGQCARQLFTFPATRCDRVVSAVLGRIGTL